MKIALIGTGRVGNLTLQYLVPLARIEKIILINRSKIKAEGVFLDTVSAFPEYWRKLKVGSFEDAKIANLLLITAGPTVKQDQSFEELAEAGLKVIYEILQKISILKDAIIVTITTPVDETAQFIQEVTKHPKEKVLGFGGSLDVARLKFLLSKETDKLAEDIDCCFLGIHGPVGLPLFQEEVKEKESLTEKSRWYFKEVAKKTGESTLFGPARQLANLLEAIIYDRREVFGVSTYHPKYGIYVTWPCQIGKQGIVKRKTVKLNIKEKEELNNILAGQKQLRSKVFRLITKGSER